MEKINHAIEEGFWLLARIFNVTIVVCTDDSAGFCEKTIVIKPERDEMPLMGYVFSRDQQQKE